MFSTYKHGLHYFANCVFFFDVCIVCLARSHHLVVHYVNVGAVHETDATQFSQIYVHDVCSLYKLGVNNFLLHLRLINDFGLNS